MFQALKNFIMGTPAPIKATTNNHLKPNILLTKKPSQKVQFIRESNDAKTQPEGLLKKTQNTAPQSLIDCLKELSRVLVNQDYADNSKTKIKRYALLGLCARLMEEIDYLQEKEIYSYSPLVYPDFPRNIRNLIWHSSFFNHDNYTDKDIEILACYLNGRCKKNEDEYKNNPIHKSFWKMHGVGSQMKNHKKEPEPSNAECITLLEFYNLELSNIKHSSTTAQDCVMKHCVGFIEAKIGSYAGLLFSPERKEDFQKNYPPEECLSLQKKYGKYFQKGRNYRHNERKAAKPPILTDYNSKRNSTNKNILPILDNNNGKTEKLSQSFSHVTIQPKKQSKPQDEIHNKKNKKQSEPESFGSCIIC